MIKRTPSDLDWQRVSNALDALIRRTNEDRFVIFSDRETERFVQFGIDKRTSGLSLDLPSQPLDAGAMLRATTYFAELGVRLSASKLYKDMEMTRFSGMQLRFEMDLANDVRRAAAIVFDIFDRIYALPREFVLVIKEN